MGRGPRLIREVPPWSRGLYGGAFGAFHELLARLGAIRFWLKLLFYNGYSIDFSKK
jgi:hypothetical protein